MPTPIFSSPSRLSWTFSTAGMHRKQGHAAAGHDAFLGRGAGGVQGVFDAGLGLLHVGLGRRHRREIIATPPESLASRSWNFSLSYSLSVSSIWRRS